MFWPYLTFYSAVLSSVSCCLLVMNLLTLWVYPFTHKEPSKQETTAETKWFQRGSGPGSGQSSRCLYVVPVHHRPAFKKQRHHALRNTCETGNNRSGNNRGNKVVPTWFPAWFRPIALFVRGSATPSTGLLQETKAPCTSKHLRNRKQPYRKQPRKQSVSNVVLLLVALLL